MNANQSLSTGVTGQRIVDANRNERHHTAAVNFHESEPLPFTSPTTHYHISDSTRHHENVTAWLAKNSGDPALKVFIVIFYLLEHQNPRLGFPPSAQRSLTRQDLELSL